MNAYSLHYDAGYSETLECLVDLDTGRLQEALYRGQDVFDQLSDEIVSMVEDQAAKERSQ